MIGLKKQRAAAAEQKAAEVPAPVENEPAASSEGKADNAPSKTTTSIFGGVGGIDVRQQAPGATTSGRRITPGEIRIQKGLSFFVCSIFVN